jgi:hypothetical protein
LDYGEGWVIVPDTNVRSRIGQPNYSEEAKIIRFLDAVKS